MKNGIYRKEGEEK